METLYIVTGAVSSIFVFLLGYSVKGVVDGKRRLDYLESYLEDTERALNLHETSIHNRVDTELEMIHTSLRETEIDIKSQLDSRIDKLTNQIIKKIPPTNDELLKRIEKMEEESYRLRMNL
tara:strand:- start:66 stop:428 length:363 start_codon:yes stop_codon:yes gene_type:complete